jgi:hypothetical protein
MSSDSVQIVQDANLHIIRTPLAWPATCQAAGEQRQ